MGYGTKFLKIDMGVRTITLKNDWVEGTLSLKNYLTSDTYDSNRIK